MITNLSNRENTSEEGWWMVTTMFLWAFASLFRNTTIFSAMLASSPEVGSSANIMGFPNSTCQVRLYYPMIQVPASYDNGVIPRVYESRFCCYLLF